MNKDKIIKESKKFTEIINEKQNIKNLYFSIYYQNSDKNMYGITIPKKIGKAHIRNKIKRRIKNIIIENENNIQNSFNYVIIVKEASLNLDYESLKNELINILKKVRK